MSGRAGSRGLGALIGAFIAGVAAAGVVIAAGGRAPGTRRDTLRFGDPEMSGPGSPRGPGALIGAFIAGVAAAGVVIAAGAACVVGFGLFNTTASHLHGRVAAWVVHRTFVNATARMSASVQPPASFSPAQVRAGLSQYARDCEVCHGGPGTARAQWVYGMNPQPPYILDAARKWTPAELYWIVDHGVKMTAMPAWGETRSQAQIWSFVAFLEALPSMSATEYQILKGQLAPAPAASEPAVSESPVRR